MWIRAKNRTHAGIVLRTISVTYTHLLLMWPPPGATRLTGPNSRTYFWIIIITAILAQRERVLLNGYLNGPAQKTRKIPVALFLLTEKFRSNKSTLKCIWDAAGDAWLLGGSDGKSFGAVVGCVSLKTVYTSSAVKFGLGCSYYECKQGHQGNVLNLVCFRWEIKHERFY